MGRTKGLNNNGSLKLSLITDTSQIAGNAWSAFVDSHPDGTIFQSPDMFEFFRSVPKFSPALFAVKDEAEHIQGILLAVTIREMKGPSAFFSSRTVIYGGPLIAPDTGQPEEVLKLLLRGLTATVSRNSIFIQFRNFFSSESFTKTFESEGFHLRDRLNLIVDTSDRDALIRNMSASRWRQIKKGLGLVHSAVSGRRSEVREIQIIIPGSGIRNPESGIPEHQNTRTQLYASIIKPSSILQVREFYDILYRLYRYKVKKPLPSWEFFEQFYRFSQQGKLGVILLVECRGKIVGGILSPVTPGKTIYEWYVCGLDQQYKEVHPSVLATWASLDYAVDHGIPKFDFMGVGIPNREYGVREFKSRFGGELVNYGRYARINNRFFYAVAETGYNFLTLVRKI